MPPRKPVRITHLIVPVDAVSYNYPMISSEQPLATSTASVFTMCSTFSNAEWMSQVTVVYPD